MFCLFTYLIVDVFSQTSKEMPRGTFLVLFQTSEGRGAAMEACGVWGHITVQAAQRSKKWIP